MNSDYCFLISKYINPEIDLDYSLPFLNHFNKYLSEDNPHLPSYFIQKLRNNNPNWKKICANTNISVRFLEKNIEKLDWETLSKNPSIPDWFFKKYIDKVSVYNYCFNTNCKFEIFKMLKLGRDISLYYLSKNIDKPVELYEYCFHLCTDGISANKNLPFEYIKENIDKLCLFNLSCYGKIDDIEFLQTHSRKLNWPAISSNPEISINTLITLRKNLRFYYLTDRLLRRPDLTEEFINLFDCRFLQKEKKLLLCRNPNMTVEGLKRCGITELGLLINNPNFKIPQDMDIKKFYKYKVVNSSLTEEQIITFKKYINLEEQFKDKKFLNRLKSKELFGFLNLNSN